MFDEEQLFLTCSSGLIRRLAACASLMDPTMEVSSPDNFSIFDFDAWALALTRAADFSGGLISLSSSGGVCSGVKAIDEK